MTRLSEEAAVALAACTGRVRLPRLTDCPPAGLEALKSMRWLLVVPPALHTPLEQFLWCLRGPTQGVVLACLAAVVGLLAAGFVLVRRLATDRPVSVTAVYGPQTKLALTPPIIALSILVGMGTFLRLTILPQHFEYWDDRGEPLPIGMYAGLDLLFCVLGAAALGTLAYAWFLRHRLKRSLQPLWSMPQSFYAREDAGRLFGCVVLLAQIGLLLWILLPISRDFNSTQHVSRQHVGLFVWWWMSGGFLVALLAAALPGLWVLARPVFLLDQALCHAYPEGIASDTGEFFTWDRLSAYSWQPDHLELKMPRNKRERAWVAKNPDRFRFGIMLRIVVPPEQRETVEAFLAERLAAAHAAHS